MRSLSRQSDCVTVTIFLAGKAPAMWDPGLASWIVAAECREEKGNSWPLGTLIRGYPASLGGAGGGSWSACGVTGGAGPFLLLLLVAAVAVDLSPAGQVRVIKS